ncbi:unnamed protein product, partial [Amoebophrya sp. A25]
ISDAGEIAVRKLGALVAQTGADGINGDTLDFIPREIYDRFRTAAGGRLALEPENLGNVRMQPWHTNGWAYWKRDRVEHDGTMRLPATSGDFVEKSPVLIDAWKYLFDTRWMSHACERFEQRHTFYLLNSYLNGVGSVAWENIW